MKRRSMEALGLSLACGLYACGGGGPSTPTGGTQTSTFTGTSTTSATGGCGSTQTHDFEASPGTVTVTLTQASASDAKVEVCEVTAGNQARECGIPAFATMQVGQTLSAPLRGARAQRITVFPSTCGQPTAATLTYTVTVTYPR